MVLEELQGLYTQEEKSNTVEKLRNIYEKNTYQEKEN